MTVPAHLQENQPTVLAIALHAGLCNGHEPHAVAQKTHPLTVFWLRGTTGQRSNRKFQCHSWPLHYRYGGDWERCTRHRKSHAIKR
ncbi:hypothetical protein KCP75_04220 [Salmonella enterica subsp. enterica]|nr:hypothetical protein KCP75_04220 [Salmonella enterica subsp. enterica]